MAISTALSTYFKKELLKGSHDFDAHTFRVALIKVGAARDYDSDMGSYSYLTGGPQYSGQADPSAASDQVTGTGYTSVYDSFSTGTEAVLATTIPDGAGGFNSVTYPKIDGSKAIVDFDDAVFQSVTVAAAGCVLYNASMSAGSDNVIATFDFGGTVSATAGDFTVQFPTPDETNAILRIA
jgi:hypothetical protein